jgi:hypothetical protein
MPPGEQRLSRQRPPTDRPELSYRLAASGDGYLLALGSSIDHLAAMVPQFADRDFSHDEDCITRDTLMSQTESLVLHQVTVVSDPSINARRPSGRPSRELTGNAGLAAAIRPPGNTGSSRTAATPGTAGPRDDPANAAGATMKAMHAAVETVTGNRNRRIARPPH